MRHTGEEKKHCLLVNKSNGNIQLDRFACFQKSRYVLLNSIFKCTRENKSNVTHEENEMLWRLSVNPINLRALVKAKKTGICKDIFVLFWVKKYFTQNLTFRHNLFTLMLFQTCRRCFKDCSSPHKSTMTRGYQTSRRAKMRYKSSSNELCTIFQVI